MEVMTTTMEVMTTTLETIVELHSVLSELSSQQARFEGVPDSMQELHLEHQQIKAEIAQLEETAKESEQQRRLAEGNAGEAQQKIERYQEQIGQVSTQREYGALLAEIDAARTIKQEQEEEALAALGRHDEAKEQRGEFSRRFDEIDGEYQSELTKWESEKPQVGERIRALHDQATALRESLPEPTLLLFERLFERHKGDPMARIDKVERAGKAGKGAAMYRCSVCNYSVRPQVVVELQNHGEVVTCDCGRQRIFFLAPS